MLTRGVLLGDRYRLGERVATGGMGAVWRGTDVLLEREVAVKVLLPSLVADQEFTARFRAEARMLAALRHPGVVPVHDVGQAVLADGSRVDYLVMEYVEGEPLSARVRASGQLNAATTMSVLAQAADALHTAHLAGIVHRDVKPGNLLVKADGTVVLVDFGIARSRDMAGLTAANMVLGTASYMSPEQATGQPVSAATDVYALGAVAYFCLAGQPPFHGDNPLAVALRHAQEEPPPLPPGTPPAVAAVVARALDKRPEDRFGSAAELAAAAADARDSTLASIPVSARPPWALAAPTPGVAAAASPAGPAPATPADLASASPGSLASASPAGLASAPSVAATPPAGSVSAGPAGSVPAGPAGSVSAGPAGSMSAGPAALRPPANAAVEATTEPKPTREDAIGIGPVGRRRPLLVGAGAVVLVALVVAVAVVALRHEATPDSADQPPALAGGSAAVTDAPLPRGDATTTGPRPSGTPGATRTATADPTGSPADATASGGPGRTAGAPGTTPTGTTSSRPTPGRTPSSRPNPYTAAQACGSGYQVIDSATLTGTDGQRKGRVFLTYHSGTGTNCVVTLKDTAVGTKSAVSAYLEVQGRARSTDSGSFDYYAGPVKASAAGTCVKWGGATGGASYGSGFEHCD
ncbi:serine/threonine-protein kinase [Micromonospora chokoriensis]|uniref:non-specific serine/threonine protein kinase n=1 Tax=Micromonospora chokoriensis TaxID=356851 RepID=A0A1C4WUR6_9ACTN|nr:serine/threonine-protein kinase [Micromonospora chokoriensis]SCE99894.1 Serine/threonine protein kinase [Micromonospora chokoriensis]